MQSTYFFFDFFICHPSPTWFRWRESGRRAESDSGGDGLLVNPRIVARRRFQSSGRRQRNRSGGFCCFSPPKSREKSFPKFYAESLRGFREVAVPTNFFLLVLLGPKVPKASAPSFSALNESADLLCRQRRHYMACAPHSFYPQGDPRLGSDGGKADGGLKARAAGTVCLQTRE